MKRASTPLKWIWIPHQTCEQTSILGVCILVKALSVWFITPSRLGFEGRLITVVSVGACGALHVVCDISAQLVAEGRNVAARTCDPSLEIPFTFAEPTGYSVWTWPTCSFITLKDNVSSWNDCRLCYIWCRVIGRMRLNIEEMQRKQQES